MNLIENAIGKKLGASNHHNAKFNNDHCNSHRIKESIFACKEKGKHRYDLGNKHKKFSSNMTTNWGTETKAEKILVPN